MRTTAQGTTLESGFLCMFQSSSQQILSWQKGTHLNISSFSVFSYQKCWYCDLDSYIWAVAMSHLISMVGPSQLQIHRSALTILLAITTVPQLDPAGLGLLYYILNQSNIKLEVIILLPTTCYLYFIMDSRGGRKMSAQSRSVHSVKQQYPNSIYIPYHKTVEAVPYYARKKKELKDKSYALQHQDEFDHSVISGDKETKTKNKLKQMITAVTIEPVINDSQFTNFDIELYPLEQHEQVKIVKEKHFPLQNYYEYMWNVKASEEIYRIAKETQKKALETLHNFGGDTIDADYDSSRRRQLAVQENLKRKGDRESTFSPYGSIRAQQERNKQLAPIHIQYQQEYKNSPFSVKQAERLKILERQPKNGVKPKY